MSDITQEKIYALLDEMAKYKHTGRMWGETGAIPYSQLRRMGNNAIDDIMTYIKDGRASNNAVRGHIIRLLTEIGTPKAISALQDQLQVESDTVHRNMIHHALRKHGIDIYQPLLDMLKTGDDEQVREAAKSLRALGDDGAAKMVALYDDVRPVAQAAIINEMTQYWRTFDAIVPYFLDGLQSEHAVIRKQVAQSLKSTRVRDDKIAPALLQALQQESDDDILHEMVFAFEYHPYQPALPTILDTIEKPTFVSVLMRVLIVYSKEGWVNNDHLPKFDEMINQYADSETHQHGNAVVHLKQLSEVLGNIGTPEARDMLIRLTEFEFSKNNRRGADVQSNAQAVLDTWGQT